LYLNGCSLWDTKKKIILKPLPTPELHQLYVGSSLLIYVTRLQRKFSKTDLKGECLLV